ncbi:hypothetical protein V462_06665 [Pantoea ananatis 15320]|nr:hypothetical protein V462_06665 [Pantoea ananatis 15320]
MPLNVLRQAQKFALEIICLREAMPASAMQAILMICSYENCLHWDVLALL